MKKAFIFYGGWEGHQPELVSARFAKMLEKEDFEVIRENKMDRLEDEEFLKSMNLIIPIWTQGRMEDRHCFHLSEAIMSGVGLAGCHGGMCDAFRWNIEYQFITGSQWVAHPGDHYYHHISDLYADDLQKTKKMYSHPDNAFYTHYEVNFKHNSSSPLVEGLEDFSVWTEQYYLQIDPCIDVLATTKITTEGPFNPNGVVEMPVIYTKRWGNGRVFYNSMGHHDDIFDIPQVAESMRRGMLWAAK